MNRKLKNKVVEKGEINEQNKLLQETILKNIAMIGGGGDVRCSEVAGNRRDGSVLPPLRASPLSSGGELSVNFTENPKEKILVEKDQILTRDPYLDDIDEKTSPTDDIDYDSPDEFLDEEIFFNSDGEICDEDGEPILDENGKPTLYNPEVEPTIIETEDFKKFRKDIIPKVKDGKEPEEYDNPFNFNENNQKDVQGVKWVFTWNNIPQLLWDKLCDIFQNAKDSNDKTFVDFLFYQIEKGKKGTVHAQGFFHLVEKKRWGYLKKHLKLEQAWLCPMKGKFQDNINYCSKSTGKIAGPFTFGTWKEAGERTDLKKIADTIRKEGISKEVKEMNAYARFPNWCREIHQDYLNELEYAKAKKFYLEDSKLQKHQAYFEKLLLEQNNRQLLWIVDRKGGKGKTFFSKYMHTKYQGKVLLISNGKKADIFEAYKNEDYVILNLVRSEEEIVNYSALELFKDGIIFKSKYNSQTIIRSGIKICVVANFDPDLDKLTCDRWITVEFDEVNKKMLVVMPPIIEKNDDYEIVVTQREISSSRPKKKKDKE